MKIKITLCLMAFILMLSLLVGCSSKNSAGDSMPSKPGANGSTSGGIAGDAGADVKPGEMSGEFERKIIRTVTMSCESKVFDDSLSVILDALEAHGGYVENSSSTGTAPRSVAPNGFDSRQERRAYYTFRVPAEKLDAFLNALRMDDGIRILSQEMTSDEITGSYYDIQTRLETLEAEKNALTVMLESFTDYKNISSMLQVQERLYNVIEEMEALRTKLNLYDSQVALSTVNLTLNEVVEYTEVEAPTFGERIGKAFSESWTAFGKGCQDFAVWFVEAFPTLMILGAIAAVVIVILVRDMRRRHRRNATKDIEQDK